MSGFTGSNPFAAAAPGMMQRQLSSMAVDEIPNTASLMGGQLTPDQIALVQRIIAGEFGLLPLQCAERQLVGQIFASLDKTNDGKLQAADFVHPIGHIHNNLQIVWQVLQDNFDFNNDGIIEPNEFLAYFVLTAIYRSESPAIDSGSLAFQLVSVHQRFMFFFQQAVQQLIAIMN